MMRNRLALACGVCAVWLACSCGESQEPPSRYNRTLGGKKEGAPLPRVAADPGILRDQKTYQPPRAPGAPAPVGTGQVGEASAQPGTAVAALLKALSEGQVAVALKLYRAEDVAALNDSLEKIFPTFTWLDRLQTAVAEKLGAGKTGQLPGLGLAGMTLEPRPQDAEHATVSPNIARILFGPVKASPSMALVLEQGAWKFKLDSPLTAADVEAIVGFHAKLQTALEKIVDWVEGSETVDLAQLLTALEQAFKGEDVQVGGPAPTTQGEPTTNPEPAGGGGRGRGIIKP